MSFSINNQNTTQKPIVSGGGINNPSNNPVNNLNKVENNISKTASGTPLDNKIVGTNQANQKFIINKEC